MRMPRKDIPQDKWISPFTLLAASATPEFRDTQFDFGKTYAYVVRSATTAGGNPLESGDSDPRRAHSGGHFSAWRSARRGRGQLPAATRTMPRPRSTSRGRSTRNPTSPAIASIAASNKATRASRSPDSLLSPSYRDTSVALGHHYWYRVTAVDHTGNESAPRPPVAADSHFHVIPGLRLDGYLEVQLLCGPVSGFDHRLRKLLRATNCSGSCGMRAFAPDVFG